MAITDKSRKTLWGRSGNRCAMCRKELVAERNEHNKNLNIGDECHIISSSVNGPRHQPDYKEDFDEYDNLILLCKNHHRAIDELYETYTVDLLRTLKRNHENWIRDSLDEARGKKGKPKFLNRITTGKQLVDIINEVGLFSFDHDELRSQEEVNAVGGLLQTLTDWGDMTGITVIERSQLTQLGFDLTKEVEQVQNLGFFIFGERTRSRMTNSSKADLGIWDIATILIVRKEHPAIINEEKILTNLQYRSSL